MFILAETISLVLSTDPHFVNKMKLAAFCERILQYKYNLRQFEKDLISKFLESLLVMMIAFITFNRSSIPLIEGLCSSPRKNMPISVSKIRSL